MGSKIAIATTGRFNPPTRGHEAVVNQMRTLGQRVSTDRGADVFQVSLFLFPTQSHDNNKNPLSFDYKIDVLEKLFGNFVHVRYNKNIRTLLEGATYLYDQGFDELYIVVGSDRVDEFRQLLEKYNGEPDRSGTVLYDFDRIEVVQAGAQRTASGLAGTVDPDEAALSAISASAARNAVRAGDLPAFTSILAQGRLSEKEHRKLAREVFNAIAEVLKVNMALEQGDRELQESWARVHQLSIAHTTQLLFEEKRFGDYTPIHDVERDFIESYYSLGLPNMIKCTLVERGDCIELCDVRVPELDRSKGLYRDIFEASNFISMMFDEQENTPPQLVDLAESFATILSVLTQRARVEKKSLELHFPHSSRNKDSLFHPQMPMVIRNAVIQKGLQRVPPTTLAKINIV